MVGDRDYGADRVGRAIEQAGDDIGVERTRPSRGILVHHQCVVALGRNGGELLKGRRSINIKRDAW
jgi:hypothetical protein